MIVNYARHVAEAEYTVELIRSGGGVAEAIRADITAEDGVSALMDRAAQTFDAPIGILVNNATGPQPMLAIEDSTWDTYLDQLLFFVKAPLLLTRSVLPAMKERRAGSIVNIGSEVVQLGNPNYASYVAAKSAMIGMTRSWANELAPHGIRVNLVAPGWIPRDGIFVPSMEAYRSKVPMKTMGDPDDIAQAVAFLASGDAKFITGQCLAVNGGNTFGI